MIDSILAAPDEDGPRLVYADWLTERADPRGEFIQVQCALTTAIGDRRVLLERRQEALLKKHQAAWLEPIRKAIRSWVWSRGFVSDVTASAPPFLGNVEMVFSTTPLQGLTLESLKMKLVPMLANTRAFKALRRLRLPAQHLTPKHLTFLEAPQWSNLRELDLSENEVRAAGIESVAALPSIRVLTLRGSSIDDAAIASLLKAPFFSSLTALDLGMGFEVSDGSAQNIALAATSLERFELGNLTDAGAFAIAQSPSMSRLKSLHAGPAVGIKAARALIDSPHLQNLRSLTGLSLLPQRLASEHMARRATGSSLA